MNKNFSARLSFLALSACLVTQQGGYAADLNLGSVQKTMTAPSAGTIRVGNQVMVIHAGAKLTPAEYVALTQSLNDGRQSLTLTGAGAAASGRFMLTPQMQQNITGLVVPQGVTSLLNAAQLSGLALTGNLVNSGNMVAFTSNANVAAANIAANNIINNATGLITTALNVPEATGVASAVSRMDLNLSALNSITNAGRILSSGNLGLTAPNIVNSGNVTAYGGNVNISAPGASAISVNNNGGTISALNGSINVSSQANATLSGGAWLSQAMNVDSGCGFIDMHVDKVAGVLGVNGGGGHFWVDNGDLNVGSANLAGDPVFVSQNGSLTQPGLVSNEAQTYIAARNITITGSLGTGESGGAVTIVAGARIIDDIAGNKYVVTGPSGLGGNVTLAGVGAINIDTSSTTGAGGDINVVAYGGAYSQGLIDLGAGDLKTAGSPSGNVTVVAAPKHVLNSTPVISFFGSVDTSTGTPGSGNVVVATATPVLTNSTTSPGLMFDHTTGQPLFNSSVSAGGTTSGSIFFDTIRTAGGDVTVKAANNAYVGQIHTGGSGFNAGDIALEVNSQKAFQIAGATSQPNASILLDTSAFNGNAGQISVTNSGPGGIQVADTAPGNGQLDASSSGGSGGTVKLLAPNGPVAFAGTGVTLRTITAIGETGGSVQIDAKQIVGSASLDAHGTNGNGGTVTLHSSATDSRGDINIDQNHLLLDIRGTTASGTLNVQSGRNLFIDTTAGALLTVPTAVDGSGATLNLQAGSADTTHAHLYVQGDLNVGNGSVGGLGIGGTVHIVLNSDENFIVGIGPATTNGITGGIAAVGLNGGQVTIENSGNGDIVVGAAAIDVSSNAATGNAGYVGLHALGNGAIKIATSANDLNYSGVVLNHGSTAGAGGTLALESKVAPIDLPHTINMSGVDGHGGSIFLSAPRYSFLNGQAQLSAAALNSGDAGVINVQTTGAALNSSISVGSGNAFDIDVHADNGSAGAVTLISGANLTVNTTNLNINAGNGNGAHLVLSSGDAPNSTLTINGAAIFATGTGGGNGGEVILVSHQASIFNVPALFVDSPVATGGHISVSSDGGLDVAATLSAQGGGSTAGKIELSSKGNIDIHSISTIIASAGGADTAGGTISIETPMDVTVNSGTVQLEGTNTGSGGAFHVDARHLNIDPSGLTILANGGPLGHGGEVSISATAPDQDLNVGSGSNQLIIHADGGSGGGNGGTIALFAGRDLTVVPSAATAAPGPTGNGGKFIFAAGAATQNGHHLNGDLHLMGALNADAVDGNGGLIDLQTSTADSMFVPSLSAQAGAVGNGGIIRVTNWQGALELPLTPSVAAAGTGNGGDIALLAPNGVIVFDASTNSLDVGAVGNGNGGSIRIDAAQITTDGIHTQVTLNATGQGTGSGGLVTITQRNANKDIHIGSNGTDDYFSIFASAGAVGDGGIVSVSSGRSLFVHGDLDAAAGADGAGAEYELTAGTAAHGLLSVQGNLDASGGAEALSGGDGGSIKLTNKDGGVVANQLLVNGTGTNNGGVIRIEANSLNQFVINGAQPSSINGVQFLAADGGATSGDAGTVEVINKGVGGILVRPASIEVLATNQGNGGAIKLSTAGNIQVLSQVGDGTLSADGAGSGLGGLVSLTAAQINADKNGGLTQISARGGDTGDGGAIKLIGTGDDSFIQIGGGSGTFALSARGGNTSGNGGYAEVKAGTVLIIPNGLDLNAPTDGNGGHLQVTTGTDQGLYIFGTLAYNGAGNGNGGEITLTTTGTQAKILVDGSILLNGSGTGSGGTLNINHSGAGAFYMNNANAMLVSGFQGIKGVVSANGGAASDSTNAAGGVVHITAQSIAVGNDSGLVPFIQADAGTRGDGGQILLDTTSGITHSGVVSLHATSSGGERSHIRLKGDGYNSFRKFGGEFFIDADGGLDSAGGLVEILSTPTKVVGDSGTITVGTGGFRITARGGSANSLGGDAGNVRIRGVKLAVNADSGLDLIARGINGNGAHIDLSTGSLTAGTVQLTGNYILNGGGATATQTAPGTGTGDGGTLNIFTVGALSLPPVIANGGAGGGNGGHIDLQTNGLLATRSNVLQAKGNGPNITSEAYNGGFINLRGKGVANNTPADKQLFINASAVGTGNGGTVTMDTGTVPISLSGLMTITATGGSVGSAAGDGGKITLKTTGTVGIDSASSLDFAPLGINGNGGTIDINAKGNVTVTGALNADGVGIGNGGVVRVASQGSGGFALGYDLLNSKAKPGISDGVSARAGSGGGNGGTIDIFSTAGSFPIDPDFAGSFDVSGTGAAGKGGKIALRGDKIVLLDRGTPLVLNASGSGSGNGGSVQLTSPNAPISVGLTSTSFRVLATGGSASDGLTGSFAGNGGDLAVVGAKGVSISATPSAVSMGPLGLVGKGASYELTSSVLSVTAGLDASGKTGGGSIFISTKDLNVGTANGNVLGSLDVSTKQGTAGSIEFIALNNMVLSNANADLVFHNAGGAYNGGSFTASSVKNITVSMPELDVSGARGGDAGNYKGGSIGIASGGSLILTDHTDFIANGAGGGDGGGVSISAVTGSLLPGNGTGLFGIAATGGEAGSGSGNGGALLLSTSKGLISIFAPALNVNPLGDVGNGGRMTFQAPAGNFLMELDTGGFALDAASRQGDGGKLSIVTSGAGKATAPFQINTGSATKYGIRTHNNFFDSFTARGGAYGAGGSINIDTASSIDNHMFGQMDVSPTGFGNGGTVSMHSGGTFTYFAAQLRADAAGTGSVGAYDGGTVDIAAKSLVIANGPFVVISANGKGEGNGGTVSITSGGTVKLNSSDGFVLEATGGSGPQSLPAVPSTNFGNGGTINVNIAAGNLAIAAGGLNTSALGSHGNGGTININTDSKSTLVVTTTLRTGVSAGTGDGGKITVNYNGTQPFQIGNSPLPAKTSGITGAIITPGGLMGGNGGTITLNMNTLSTFLGLNTQIQAGGSSAGGAGGTIELSAKGLLDIAKTSGNFLVDGRGNGAYDGGTLKVTAGFINLPATGLDLAARGNGNGAGTGLGKGGTVMVTTTTATQDLAVDASGTKSFHIDVRGGLADPGLNSSTSAPYGSGGNVSITSAKGINKVVGDGLQIIRKVEDHGTLSLTAAKGIVVDGIIETGLGSKDSTMTVTANGGAIAATSGVLRATNLTLISSTGIAGGAPTADISVDAIQLSVNTKTGNALIAAANVSGGGGNHATYVTTSKVGGNLSINTIEELNTIGRLTAKNVTLTSAQDGITLNEHVDAGGTGVVTLNTPQGSILQTQNAILAKTVNLTAADDIGAGMFAPIQMALGDGKGGFKDNGLVSVSATTNNGSVFLYGVASKLTVLNGMAAADGQTFSAQSDSDLTVGPKAVISSDKVVLATNTLLNVQGNVSTLNTGTLNVAILTGGAITTNSKLPVTSGNVNLFAQASSFLTGATGAVTATTNTPVLNVQQSGDATKPVTVNNVGTSGLSVQAGSTTKSVSITSKGGIDLHDFTTTSGDIKVTAATGNLFVSGHVTANEGSVVLHNLDDTNGTINVDNNAIIETHVTKPVKGAVGIVQIYLGAAPGAVAGTIPASIDPNNVTVLTPGKVLWGANGIVGTSTTQIQALHQTVQFSTGKAAATAINLGTNTLIKADPPAPVSQTAINNSPLDYIVDTEFDATP